MNENNHYFINATAVSEANLFIRRNSLVYQYGWTTITTASKQSKRNITQLRWKFWFNSRTIDEWIIINELGIGGRRRSFWRWIKGYAIIFRTYGRFYSRLNIYFYNGPLFRINIFALASSKCLINSGNVSFRNRRRFNRQLRQFGTIW